MTAPLYALGQALRVLQLQHTAGVPQPVDANGQQTAQATVTAISSSPQTFTVLDWTPQAGATATAIVDYVYTLTVWRVDLAAFVVDVMLPERSLQPIGTGIAVRQAAAVDFDSDAPNEELAAVIRVTSAIGVTT